MARAEYFASLENDLNTAEARAPIFDLVRAANTAMDEGRFFLGDRDAVVKVLKDFDRVFDVMEDNDTELTRQAVDWAEENGRRAEIAPELRARMALSDAEIDALVEERTRAKKMRNFGRADAIRAELAEKGVVIEDSKDGVRWKRK